MEVIYSFKDQGYYTKKDYKKISEKKQYYKFKSPI